MPTFTESGHQFELPDERSFRFEECETYQSLKSSNLKEMDFGWIEGREGQAQTVWLLEVSNYALGSDVRNHFDLESFLDEIRQKITDCITMLAAIWNNTEVGQRLRLDIEQTCPAFPNYAVGIRPTVLLKIGGADAPQKIQLLTHSLRPRLRGRLRCAGSSDVLMFSLDRTPPASALPIQVTEL